MNCEGNIGQNPVGYAIYCSLGFSRKQLFITWILGYRNRFADSEDSLKQETAKTEMMKIRSLPPRDRPC